MLLQTPNTTSNVKYYFKRQILLQTSNVTSNAKRHLKVSYVEGFKAKCQTLNVKR